MKAWTELFKAVCKLCLYLFGAICVIVIPVGVFIVALYSMLILIITYVPVPIIVGTILFFIIIAGAFGGGKG